MWDLERIKQEIAFVYENTMAKGVGKLPKNPRDLLNKYEYNSTNGFKILIEVDDLGKIMNAYPIIK
ncbi:hypothetical protein [Myroides fluvii]|uniref:hypothetical protein n=1 Tax=Myroides fluvii TaxID=2572594 RepID=UPI00131A8981|nr:hypothetical protein [Myroides fluvii]